MKKSTLKKVAIYSAATGAVLFLAAPTFAQGNTQLNLAAPSAAGTANGASASVIIRFVINGLIVIGIVAALLFMLWGGIRWILSGGDKGKVDAARSTIVASIVGLIIVILAWVVINTVLQVLTGCNLGQFQLPNLSNNGGEVPCSRVPGSAGAPGTTTP